MVIAIIGILATIVVSSLDSARSKATVAAGKAFAAQVDIAEGDQAVGEWNFNECSGTTAGDASGNGNTAALVNSPTWSTDTPTGTGCSISFGSSSYLNAGSNSSLTTIGSQVTVMGWIKVLTTTPYSIIFSNDRDVAGTYNGFGLGVYYSTPFFRIWNGGPTSINVNGPAIQNNQWYHLAGVYDGSLISLYINGAYVGSIAYSGGIGTPPSFAATIGALGACPSGCAKSTEVYAVHIFTKALTAMDISRLYAEEAPRFLVADR